MLVKLKDVCTFESNNFNKKDNWTFVNYLDTSNLTENVIQDFQYLEDLDNLPSRAKRKVKIGDILFSSVRPNQKHYGFIDKEYPNLLVSTGFIVLTPTEKVNNKFLYYWLIQDKTIDILQTKAETSTSAYPSITKEDMYDLEIDLPPLEIQDKIANILSNIDNQIERNNAMTKRLQVLGNTIYSKEINKDTKYFNLKTVANISTGKEDANFASPNGKYNFYTCSEEISKCDEFAFDGNSILIAGNGNFNVKYYNGKFNAYQRTYVIQNNTLFGNIYYSSLRSVDGFTKNANGSIIKFITLGLVQDIQIPILSDKTNILLNDIVSQKNKIILETEKLNQLKNKLLPLLINSQLEV